MSDISCRFIDLHFHFCRIELAPLGTNLDIPCGRVEVWFSRLSPAGDRIPLVPGFVRVNAAFNDLHPDEATAWGEVIQIAATFARARYPGYTWSAGMIAEWRKLIDWIASSESQVNIIANDATPKANG